MSHRQKQNGRRPIRLRWRIHDGTPERLVPRMVRDGLRPDQVWSDVQASPRWRLTTALRTFNTVLDR